jgi:hypothetical protein
MDKLKELVEALGWKEILSKNDKMFSFVKDDLRLNYYFTTGTLTVQGPNRVIKVHKDVMDLVTLEEIICTIN